MSSVGAQKGEYRVEKFMGAVGMLNTEDYGVRRTAYDIRHETDAEYHFGALKTRKARRGGPFGR